MNYDSFARTYLRTRTAVSRMLQPLLDEAITLPTNSSILDIGCGTGNYCIGLKDHFPNLDYFGFDLSKEMLNIARSRDNQIHFIIGNADKSFPYKDSKFELEFMINVSHHITDLNQCFKEISRTLKPNGILIMTADSEVNIRARTAVRLFPGVLEIELERYLSEEEANRHAKNNGLQLKYSKTLQESNDITNEVIMNIEQRPTSSFRLLSDSQFEEGMKRLKEAFKRGEKWFTNNLVLRYRRI